MGGSKVVRKKVRRKRSRERMEGEGREGEIKVSNADGSERGKSWSNLLLFTCIETGREVVGGVVTGGVVTGGVVTSGVGEGDSTGVEGATVCVCVCVCACVRVRVCACVRGVTANNKRRMKANTYLWVLTINT